MFDIPLAQVESTNPFLSPEPNDKPHGLASIEGFASLTSEPFFYGSISNRMIRTTPMCSAKINSFYTKRCFYPGLLFSLLALMLAGCGGEETPEVKQVAALPPTVTPAPPAVTQPPTPSATPDVSPTPTDTEVPPTVTPTPIPPTPTLTPTPVEMIEVDIAALKQFPDLKFTFSGTIPSQGTPEAVLMDGAPLVEGATGTNEIWVANAPARFEVIVPNLGNAFQITRVEITGPGKDQSLPEFIVSIQTPGNPEWQRLSGTMGLRMQQGPGMKQDEEKSICAFSRIQASAVRIDFPTGGEGSPGQVFVTDIDVIGTAPKGSLP